MSEFSTLVNEANADPLNNICFSNFTTNSSPANILALGLLLTVYGPGLGPDGPGCLEKP